MTLKSVQSIEIVDTAGFFCPLVKTMRVKAQWGLNLTDQVCFTWANIVWRAVVTTFPASICTKSKLVRVKGGREAGPCVLCTESLHNVL